MTLYIVSCLQIGKGYQAIASQAALHTPICVAVVAVDKLTLYAFSIYTHYILDKTVI